MSIVGDLEGGGYMAGARYITLDQKSQKRTKKVSKQENCSKKEEKVHKKVNVTQKIPHTGDTESLNQCG